MTGNHRTFEVEFIGQILYGQLKVKRLVILHFNRVPHVQIEHGVAGLAQRKQVSVVGERSYLTPIDEPKSETGTTVFSVWNSISRQ